MSSERYCKFLLFLYYKMLSDDVIPPSGIYFMTRGVFVCFHVTFTGASDQLSYYSVTLLFVASSCEGEHRRTSCRPPVDILDLSFGRLSSVHCTHSFFFLPLHCFSIQLDGFLLLVSPAHTELPPLPVLLLIVILIFISSGFLDSGFISHSHRYFLGLTDRFDLTD